MYTDEQIMDSVVGSKALTHALCNVVRSAIALSKSPLNTDLLADVCGEAAALSMFLPRPTELAKVEAAFGEAA